MKKRILSIMLGLVIWGNVQAQEDFSSFEFMYQPVVLVSNYYPIQGDFRVDGFAFAYNHGFCMNENVPFYFTTGLKFQYLYARRNRPYVIDFINEQHQQIYANGTLTNNVDLLNFQIPLTLSFKWNISEFFGLEPFAGFDLSAYPLAKLRYSYDFIYQGLPYYLSDNLNMLSNSDMSNIQYVENNETKSMVGANWFQVGWHAGLTLRFAMISVTAQYGEDFTNFFPDSRWRRSSISFGFCF